MKLLKDLKQLHAANPETSTLTPEVMDLIAAQIESEKTGNGRRWPSR